MTAAELLKYGLTLPPVDREIIACCLWESLPASGDIDLPEILAEVDSRNAEMDADQQIGRTHEEVIAAARRALQCE